MSYSELLIGNTSSGIIEAASFGKYVVNVGDRQKGRAQGDNVSNVPFNSNEILNCAKQLLNQTEFSGENIYYTAETADHIVKIIKDL